MDFTVDNLKTGQRLEVHGHNILLYLDHRSLHRFSSDLKKLLKGEAVTTETFTITPLEDEGKNTDLLQQQPPVAAEPFPLEHMCIN